MSDKNAVKILLNGAEFIIKAEEDKEYIERISKIVDSRILDVLNNTQNTNLYMATVVTALNYCDELVKEKIKNQDLLKELENVNSRFNDKESHINETNRKLAENGLENERLKKDNAELLNQIELLNLKIAHLQSQDATNFNQVNLNSEIQQSQQNIQVQQNKETQLADKKPQKLNVKVVSNNRNRRVKQISKIDYQEKDKINPEYRRDDFQDKTSDDDMISMI